MLEAIIGVLLTIEVICEISIITLIAQNLYKTLDINTFVTILMLIIIDVWCRCMSEISYK